MSKFTLDGKIPTILDSSQVIQGAIGLVDSPDPNFCDRCEMPPWVRPAALEFLRRVEKNLYEKKLFELARRVLFQEMYATLRLSETYLEERDNDLLGMSDESLSLFNSIFFTHQASFSLAIHACAYADFNHEHPDDTELGPARSAMCFRMVVAFLDHDTYDALWEDSHAQIERMGREERGAWQTTYNTLMQLSQPESNGSSVH